MYEAHITFSKEHRSFVRHAATQLGWKFSGITGDPVLGDGDFIYLSAHGDDGRELLDQATSTAAKLAAVGVPNIRIKIEKIIFDTKTGIYVDELK